MKYLYYMKIIRVEIVLNIAFSVFFWNLEGLSAAQ